MEYKIITDSCADFTDELSEQLGICSVPLTMRLGEKEFKDDDSLKLDEFMAEMQACTDKVGSAAPDPQLYRNAMESTPESFVVTLSSKLSASYSNALIAKDYAEEDGKHSVHVFDSKSASAGETLIAMKIRELIDLHKSRDVIIKTVENFIKDMKTYFVLENYDNLLKNGRLHKITGTLIRILNIKLLMGSDGNGNIKLYGKPKGIKQMIDNLLALIHESGKNPSDEKMVIAHCNNRKLADSIRDAVKARFGFKDIIIVPTGGLSSLYADNQGVILAF